MFESVNVIGAAASARRSPRGCDERGVALRERRRRARPALRARQRRSPDVARDASDPGRWVAHVSGATPLAALDPHALRFGVHPLQTFMRSRGPEQLDGAWAAVTGETAEARDARRLARRTLGLRPFDLADEHARALPRRRGDRVELPRHAAPGRVRSSRPPARRPRRSSR